MTHIKQCQERSKNCLRARYLDLMARNLRTRGNLSANVNHKSTHLSHFGDRAAGDKFSTAIFTVPPNQALKSTRFVVDAKPCETKFDYSYV